MAHKFEAKLYGECK